MMLASSRRDACRPPRRRKLIELPSANRVALGEGPVALRQHVAGHHVDGLRDAGDGQIERQICRLASGHFGVGAALVEPRQRRDDAVFAGRQIGDAEPTVLRAEQLRDLLIGRVLDGHFGARQTDLAGLGRDQPLQFARVRLRSRARGQEGAEDNDKNGWSQGQTLTLNGRSRYL